MKAADIMTRDVVCLNEELDLHECEKILLERAISGAPVVDTEGRLLGVLSKTDLLSHHYVSGEEEGGAADSPRVQTPRGTHVFRYEMPTARDVMTPVPCIATEWATIGELATLMVRREVHRIVICRQRKVVGIVSSMDVLRAIATEPCEEAWDPGGFPG